MSKGGAQTPPAADPVAMARAQTASNRETADLNRVNQFSPGGSSEWSVGPDGRWTQTQSLNPTGQEIFSGTQNIAKGLMAPAGDLAAQVGTASTKPLDFSGVNQDFLRMGPEALNARGTQAAY